MLVFIDGCDHYITQQQMYQKWQAVMGNATPLEGRGRWGGGAFWSDNNYGTIFDGTNRMTVGFHFQFTDPGITPYGHQICGFTCSSDSNVSTFGYVGFTQDRIITYKSGLVSSGFEIEFDQWYFIEAQVEKTSETTYVFRLRVDGVQVLAVSDALPIFVAPNGNMVDVINFGFRSNYSISAFPAAYDDVYITSGESLTNNSFLGEIRIDTIYPNANHGPNDFLSSDANPNYQNISGVVTDQDSRYVYNNVPNKLEVYDLENMSRDKEFFALQTVSSARKDDSRVRTVRSFLQRLDVREYGLTRVMSRDYRSGRDIFLQEPRYGSLWTQKTINETSVGFEEIL